MDRYDFCDIIHCHRCSFQIAWTTAAVGGTRVLGAVPIVLDMVNLQQVRIICVRHDQCLLFSSIGKITIEYVKNASDNNNNTL